MFHRLATRGKRIAIRITSRFRFVVRREIRGQKVLIPVQGTRGLGLLREREPEVAEAISSLIQGRRGMVVDVGANLGQTLLAVWTTNTEIAYLGFEPNPTACAYIQDLIRTNRLPRAQVVALALSSESSIQKLLLTSDASSSQASLTAAHKQAGFFTDSITVVVENGDAALQRINAQDIALIKIDVEGLEASVLKGLEETIRRERPPILIEVLGPLGSAEFAVNQTRIENAKAIEGWARSHRFVVMALRHGRAPAPVEDLADYVKKQNDRNFLLVPNESQPNPSATEET